MYLQSSSMRVCLLAVKMIIGFTHVSVKKHCFLFGSISFNSSDTLTQSLSWSETMLSNAQIKSDCENISGCVKHAHVNYELNGVKVIRKRCLHEDKKKVVLIWLKSDYTVFACPFQSGSPLTRTVDGSSWFQRIGFLCGCIWYEC